MTNQKLDFNLKNSNDKSNFQMQSKNEINNNENSNVKKLISFEESQNDIFFEYSKTNDYDYDENDEDDNKNSENNEKSEVKNNQINDNNLNVNKLKLNLENQDEIGDKYFESNSDTIISSILNCNIDLSIKESYSKNMLNLVSVKNNSLLFDENRIDYCHIYYPIGAKININSVCSEILFYFQVEKYNSFKTLFTKVDYEEYKRCAFIDDNIIFMCKLIESISRDDESDDTDNQNNEHLELLIKYETSNIYRILEYVRLNRFVEK